MADNSSIETELKLAFPPAVERDLAEHPALQPPRASPPESRRIISTYFDTPDNALDRNGVSLRIRRANGENTQTIKARAQNGVATERGEWEWPLMGDQPDLSLAQGAPVADRLPSTLAAQLQPVVVTDVMRTARTLHLEGDTVVEAAIDRGSIAAGGAKEPVCEIELELLSGEAGPLYRLALELHETAPVTVGVESKAARGYRLKDGAAAAPKEPAAPELDRDVIAVEAFRRIIVSEIGCLLANQPAAKAGDAEGVHQMRVGIRRLRSVLTLFAPLLAPEVAEIFQGELKRIGRVFGEARDWDVFCQEALPKALHVTRNVGWIDRLRKSAVAWREAAHAEFLRELDAKPFTGMVLGLTAWAEEGRTHPRLVGAKRLQRPLLRLAPKLLDELARKVDRRGRDIAEESGGALHALRKSLKKLRYGVEYLAPLYPRKNVKAYLKLCKALQKSLGAINDAATATRRARQVAEAGQTNLTVSVGAVAESARRPRRKAIDGLSKKWAAFHARKRFWA